MVNYESEIKKTLIKLGGPSFIEEWFQKPSPMFGGLSPRQMLDQSRGAEVLDRLNKVVLTEENNESELARLKNTGSP